MSLLPNVLLQGAMNGLWSVGRSCLWTRGRILCVTPRQRGVHLQRPECPAVPWRSLSSGAERPKAENEPNRNHHEQAKQRARMFTLATASATAALGGMYVLYRQLSAQENSSENTGLKQDQKAGEEIVEEAGKEEKGAKKHISFHDRRMMNYEDRIRAYSTPEKIFRYFATLKIVKPDGSSQIYMTPDDFLRCITPGILQPPEYGLDLFRTITIEKWMKEWTKEQQGADSARSSSGVLGGMSKHGLISYFDFLFLLTILATPMRHFELAFKMFDLNGDGDVELKEFEKVKSTLVNSTGHAASGVKSKNPHLIGKGSGVVEDGLTIKFFGENKDKKLTIREFGSFHEALRMEVLQLEFNRFEPTDGRITEKDFAKLVLTTAVNSQAMKKYLKRVQSSQGITFEEVQQFAQVLDSLRDVETALSMYSAAGASVTQAELKHVVKAVAGVKLSDHLVDTVFTLFDENGDGQLSHAEFIKVLRSRRSRGLDKSSAVGFMKLVKSTCACSIKTVEDKLGLK